MLLKYVESNKADQTCAKPKTFLRNGNGAWIKISKEKGDAFSQNLHNVSEPNVALVSFTIHKSGETSTPTHDFLSTNL